MLSTFKFTISRKFYCLVFLFASMQSFGLHIATSQISYTATRISPDSVQVDLQLRLLRGNNLSLPHPANASVQYYSYCDGSLQTLSLPLDTIMEVFPKGSRCVNPSGGAWGTDKVSFYRTTLFFVNENCIDGLFYWYECCRDNNIFNLSSLPGPTTMYASASLYLVDNSHENTNPVLSENSLSAIGCVGRMVHSGNFWQDPDGDSLFVELGHSLSFNQSSSPPTTSAIPFGGGHSLANPVSSANGITLNPSTGELTYQATQVEITMISYRIKEYRYLPASASWVMVSELIYDQMFTVDGFCGTTVDSINFQGNDSLSQSQPGYKPSIEASCGDSSFVVHFNQYLDTRTLSGDGSELSIYSSTYNLNLPITQLEPLNVFDSLFNTLNVQLANPINFNDSLVVYTQNGSDGNTLMSECGVFMEPNDTLYLLVSDCSSAGVPEADIEDALVTLYPNPSTNSLWLESRHPNARFEEVKVFDASGRLMQHPFTAKSESRLTLHVENLSEGVYFIHIRLSSGAFVLKKFIKE